MKALLITAAISLMSVTAASADYRLPPKASPDERDRYELYHAQTGEFHTGRAAGMHSSVGVTRPSGVFRGGQYRGNDPDANVRYELRRETSPADAP